jgi:hypothetical protein
MPIWKIAKLRGWLEFSLACDYISKETYITLHALFDEIGRIVRYMMKIIKISLEPANSCLLKVFAQ